MSGNRKVVEVYKGVKIREMNLVNIQVSAPIFKFFILEAERTGLPITKLLAYSGKPCEKCTNIDVIIFGKDGEEIKIKRGMLSRHIPENHGRGIIQQGNEASNRSSEKDL